MSKRLVLLIAAVCAASLPAFAANEGVLDVADCGVIAGWAWDTTMPNTAVYVDIYDGTIFVASVLAGNFRQDLVNAGKGNGYHGFAYTTPAILRDGATHNLRVQFAGTSTLLSQGSHFSIQCSPGSVYQFYSADALTSVDGSKWTQNGVVSPGGGGLTGASSSGGSLISKVAIPANGYYIVDTTLHLPQSGGTYITYMRASADALSGPSLSGSFYAFEIQNPTFANGGCSAILAIYKRNAGVLTQVQTSTVACRDGMVLRVVHTFNNQMAVFIDRHFAAYARDAALVGQPGVGVRGAPTANSISLVQLGPTDTVAPSGVASSSVATTSLSSRVDFQWANPPADSAATGVAFYTIWRDAVQIGISLTAESRTPR